MTIKSLKTTFVSRFPEGFNYSFYPNLYNRLNHLKLIGNGRIQSFYLIEVEKQLILGAVHFLIDQDEAISLPRRPFGSFEFSNSLGFELIYEFMQWVLHQLVDLKINKVTIKTYSQIYHEKNQNIIHFVLNSLGFIANYSDINHHLHVDQSDFKQKIKMQEKRRLSKCYSETFVFHQEPREQLRSIYLFIEKCRSEKNVYSLMKYDDLERSYLAFPDEYLIFTVKKDTELLAATIAVKVNQEVLYNFLPASSTEYNAFSPMVMLMEGLYHFCQKNAITTLDLGISSINHLPQVSLIRFKENIGGVPSVKISFTKKQAQ